MAIKVTLGEVNAQEIKSFPKLMRAHSGYWKGLICFFTESAKGIIFDGKNSGYADNFNPLDFSDYNEPITIQNT